jgi:hypothetical protein
MTAARDLVEQFSELPTAAVYPAATGGDPVAVDDAPQADAADAPVAACTEPSRAELLAAFARLESDNRAMAAKIAAFEAPPEEHWVELKHAAHDAYRPTSAKDAKNANERMRRLIESKKVEAKKQDGRWYVDENGPKMRARLKLNAKQGLAWNAARGQNDVSSVSVG